MIGGTRKPSKKRPTTRQYSYYGECIASDLCEMPATSPFGFRYMLCFYDLATKYLEVYYLCNASDAEVKSSFHTFLADNQRYLSGRLSPGLPITAASSSKRTSTRFVASSSFATSTQYLAIRRSTPLRACGVFSYALVASVWQQP
eukprot:1828723-Pleurochrysis_carterae.AAC.1